METTVMTTPSDQPSNIKIQPNTDIKQLLDVLKALQTLAASNGVVVSFSIPEQQDPLTSFDEDSPPVLSPE